MAEDGISVVAVGLILANTAVGDSVEDAIAPRIVGALVGTTTVGRGVIDGINVLDNVGVSVTTPELHPISPNTTDKTKPRIHLFI